MSEPTILYYIPYLVRTNSVLGVPLVLALAVSKDGMGICCILLLNVGVLASVTTFDLDF